MQCQSLASLSSSPPISHLSLIDESDAKDAAKHTFPKYIFLIFISAIWIFQQCVEAFKRMNQNEYQSLFRVMQCGCWCAQQPDQAIGISSSQHVLIPSISHIIQLILLWYCPCTHVLRDLQLKHVVFHHISLYIPSVYVKRKEKNVFIQIYNVHLPCVCTVYVYFVLFFICNCQLVFIPVCYCSW